MIFLQQHGITPSLASRIYKRLGARAVAEVQERPYRLALDVWGVGFKTADRIARSVGISPDAPERAQAGVYQILHDLSTKGHDYTTRGEVAALAAEMLSRPAEAADEATTALAAGGHAHVERLPNGEEAAYRADLYKTEVRLARRLGELLARKATGGALDASIGAAVAEFERKTGVTLAPAQRDAVEQAAHNSKVLVVTGGPGVGKTTIVRAIIALFDKARIPVRLAAPTGRAAKRMSEATGREAMTLHRLLEFDPKRRSFAREHGRPIEARGRLIVDEASMLDSRAGRRAAPSGLGQRAARAGGRRRPAPRRWGRARCCGT